MANFAGIEDMEAFLQVSISSATQIAAAERALTEATAAIRNYCRQHLELVADDAVTLDSRGGTRLLLPELPVVSVASVVEDGEALTVTDDYKLGQHGILHRVGAKWLKGIQVVVVTYSHGYAELPDDVVNICTRAASRAYQAGLTTVENEGALGVASKSLGDYSVAFQGDQGGGVSDGLMGASGARMLLMSEKDILDQYRL
jgi:hypothetical protein